MKSIKHTSLAAAALLAALAWLGSAHADDVIDENLAEARKLARDFGARLRDHLQHTLQEQGPVAAIDACHLQAPGISNRLQEMHITVRRTSLKPRNPDNVPDAWERRVLEFFDAEQAAGADATRLEHYALLPDGDTWQFRYARAIPTGPVCLACHGEAVSQEVAHALAERYPADQARGYSPGQVRGAFSITIRNITQ